MKKTLRLKVDVDPSTEEVFQRYGEATAKWETRAFAAMYSEWRRTGGRWKMSALRDYLRLDGRKLVVDKRSLYTYLLTEKPTPRKGKVARASTPVMVPCPPGLRSHVFLQASLTDLGTSFENFLDPKFRQEHNAERRQTNRLRRNVAKAKKIAKERGMTLDLGIGADHEKQMHLAGHPRILKQYRRETMFWPQGLSKFKPCARFIHRQVMFKNGKDGLINSIVMDHPYEKGKLTVHLPQCYDPVPPEGKPEVEGSYRYKLQWLDRHLHTLSKDGQGKNFQKVGVEFHHTPGHAGRMQWYAHIVLEVEEADLIKNPRSILGVHIGERDTATATLATATGLKGPSLLRQGRKLRQEIDFLHARRRKMRQAYDRGNRDTRPAMERLKEKEMRLRKEEAHVVSRAIIDKAQAVGAESISMEKLSSKFPRLEEKNKGAGSDATKQDRQWNRRVFNWNRGVFQTDLAYKAKLAGFRLAGKEGEGVSPVWDSHTCPKCGESLPEEARSRKRRTLTCPSCGILNDDVSASMIVAERGYEFFHPPRMIPKPDYNPPSTGHEERGGPRGSKRFPARGSKKPSGRGAYPTSRENESDQKDSVPPGNGPILSTTKIPANRPEGAMVYAVADNEGPSRSSRSVEVGKGTANIQATGPGGEIETTDEVKGQTSARADVMTDPREGARIGVKTEAANAPKVIERPKGEEPLENGPSLTPEPKGSRRNG